MSRSEIIEWPSDLEPVPPDPGVQIGILAEFKASNLQAGAGNVTALDGIANLSAPLVIAATQDGMAECHGCGNFAARRAGFSRWLTDAAWPELHGSCRRRLFECLIARNKYITSFVRLEF